MWGIGWGIELGIEECGELGGELSWELSGDGEEKRRVRGVEGDSIIIVGGNE
jgi:hypothetical protein